MKNILRTSLLFLIYSGLAMPMLCQPVPHSGISVVSYLLRDRAVVIDSLVLRKTMYVGFRINQNLGKVRKSAVTGILSHNGIIMSRDTTWLFDEAAGNLGLNLPFNIPDGIYTLGIYLINTSGKIVDSLKQDFNRSDLKPYFNREISYWDFTTPYAHLECSGFGEITYHFTSLKLITGLKSLLINARMNSDNDEPGRVEVLLNGSPLGKFDLPGVEAVKSTINWQVIDAVLLEKCSIIEGENQLTFRIDPQTDLKGMGLRIYSHKNSTNPSVKPELPVTLSITGINPSDKEVFTIPVWGEEGEHVTSKFTIPEQKTFRQQPLELSGSDLELNQSDIELGYVLFDRDFQRYISPWTIPTENERIKRLNHEMSRNDFDPVTFCVYPVRDLGAVKITVSDLTSTDGHFITSENILVQVARNMKIRTGEGNTYQIIPRLLDRTDHTEIPLANTTRFWLTVHADSLTLPGKYTGTITISPEKEKAFGLPLTIEVLPVTLTAVPGIDYFMCMSYEFFEMENKEWSTYQKKKIYLDGVNSFRDYINHGMTTVMTSSPYYFQWNSNGTPRLEHLTAMLQAARETGFKRPVFWYYGHYLQAAKGQHPGNIRLYDPKVHPARAESLARTALKIDRELNAPPLYFMPIDEPRIAQRKKITLELLRAIKNIPGTVTTCTTNIGGKLLDIENNSQVDRVLLKPGEKERKSDRKVWEYNNTVVDCLNPCYSRYIYGYYTWRQDLDGMNSWGPGTTENSRGNPFEDLDHEFTDYAITYPHTGGPLATPNWEALREGIDDVRYIYQLEQRCYIMGGNHPEEVAEVMKFLDSIRAMCDFDDRSIINEPGKWTPERFMTLRKQVTDWILKLDAL
jgi:hypothetical protein